MSPSRVCPNAIAGSAPWRCWRSPRQMRRLLMILKGTLTVLCWALALTRRLCETSLAGRGAADGTNPVSTCTPQGSRKRLYAKGRLLDWLQAPALAGVHVRFDDRAWPRQIRLGVPQQHVHGALHCPEGGGRAEGSAEHAAPFAVDFACRHRDRRWLNAVRTRARLSDACVRSSSALVSALATSLPPAACATVSTPMISLQGGVGERSGCMRLFMGHLKIERARFTVSITSQMTASQSRRMRSYLVHVQKRDLGRQEQPVVQRLAALEQALSPANVSGRSGGSRRRLHAGAHFAFRTQAPST